MKNCDGRHIFALTRSHWPARQAQVLGLRVTGRGHEGRSP